MSIFKLAQEVREGNKVLVKLLVGIGDLLAAQQSRDGASNRLALDNWADASKEALDSIE